MRYIRPAAQRADADASDRERSAERIDLKNRITIEVHAALRVFAATR
jgi:hypothetical protein